MKVVLVVVLTVNRRGSRDKAVYCSRVTSCVFVFVFVCVFHLCTYFNSCDWGDREGSILWQCDLVCFVFIFVCVCLCLFFVSVPLSIVVIGGEGGILLQRDLTKAVNRRPHRHTSRKKGKARQQKKIRERKCDEKHH